MDNYGAADVCARPANFNNAGTLINNNVKQLIAFVHAEHAFSDSLRVNAELNFSRQRFEGFGIHRNHVVPEQIGIPNRFHNVSVQAGRTKFPSQVAHRHL